VYGTVGGKMLIVDRVDVKGRDEARMALTDANGADFDLEVRCTPSRSTWPAT
jgi:hypothetical protein